MFVPAPIGKRILGGLIDYVVLMVIAIIISIIFGTDWRFATMMTFIDTPTTGELIGQIAIIPSIIFGVIFLGYFILFESLARTSVGKTIMSMTIVKEDGTAIGVREALIRTFYRGIDGAPFWYFVGLITIFLSPTHQRVGDHSGQAIVVEKATVETTPTTQ